MNRNMMIDDNDNNDNVSTSSFLNSSSSCYLNLSNLLKQYHATSTLYRYIIEGTDITFQEYLYEILLSSDDDDNDNNDDRVDFITSLLLGHMNSTREEREEEINENEIRDSIQNIVEAINASHRNHNDTTHPTPPNKKPLAKETHSAKIETSSSSSTMFIQSPVDDVVIVIPKQDSLYERKQSKTIRKDNKKKQQLQIHAHEKIINSNYDNDDNDNIGTGPRGSHFNSNYIHSNIHLTKVSILMDNGNELLQDAIMDIQRGHCYGLVGRNGVGKTTLLKKIASHHVPGLPKDLRILLVHQQVQVHNDDITTTLEYLISSDTDRTRLVNEQIDIENQLDNNTNVVVDNDEKVIYQLSQRLHDITIELDIIDSDNIEHSAKDILKGLQFTDTMINNPISYLSGGWRMRLALAQALIRIKSIDLILLDECSNHLDLNGLDWLIQFLTKQIPSNVSLIIVSHDRSFLDEVCTDIIILSHQRLIYHVGNYTEYERQQYEKSIRETQILDSASRQIKKANEFIQKNTSNYNDPNKQRQAKIMKEKKLDRIGNYRIDGKRYKQYSLKTLDEKSVRRAQKVEIDIDEPILTMNFPNPTSWPTSISAVSSPPIIRMKNVSFAYSNSKLHTNENNSKEEYKKDDINHDKNMSSTSSSSFLLNNITLHLNRGSKVALVGKNGTGKSTLCKLICGEFNKGSNDDNSNNKEHINLEGEIWVHPNIRIGHITQYTIEELELKYSNKTVLEYAEMIDLRHSKASSEIINNKNNGLGNVRQYLGLFGLGSTRLALSPIQQLSGGEKMRLSFATVFANESHLLFLDEITNHIDIETQQSIASDIETQQSIASSLRTYTGSVLMVSHNQAFLSSFCEELWILNENGYINCIHNDTESFDEIFTKYRQSLLFQQHHSTTISYRQNKLYRAKQATQHKKSSNIQVTGFVS